MANVSLSESLQKATERMEKILRSQTRSSKDYMNAVREYQHVLHLIDSAQAEVEVEV